MSKLTPPKKSTGKVPDALARYLENMEADVRLALEELFESALQEAGRLAVFDLWEEPEFAVTYWILLLSGINQEEEKDIANELLFWKTFLAKQSARVICVQSSDRREFRCCSSTFGVVNCPSLIFSDNPDMADFIKVKPQLLLALASQKGGLQRFFTRIHSLIENGRSILDVQVILDSEKFWAGLKIVYGEVKGLVAFKKDL